MTIRSLGVPAAGHRPSRRAQVVIAMAITAALTVGACVLAVSGFLDGARPALLSWLVLPPLFAILGAIIVSRTDGNSVGWLLLVIGSAIALEPNADMPLLEVAPTNLTPGRYLLLVGDQISWMTWVFPLFLLLYVFPTGHLRSRRWLWVPILQTVMFVTLTFLSAFSELIGPVSEAWNVPNPIGFISPAVRASSGFLIGWGVCLLLLTGGAVASITMRYRTAGDVERAQLKWVLSSVVLFSGGYLFLLATSGWTDDSILINLVLILAVGGIPVAMFIAVLKFHLYEIDVIISKSITFGALAVFIGAVYVGTVVGVGALFGQADGSNVTLSVTATALVALAFQPVRSRVERFANRLVYGKRATPYEVLARFSQRVAEEADEDVLDRIPRLLVDGTGAAVATLWVRRADGFRAASVWPQSELLQSLDNPATFVDPDADVSLPVFHDGELLGGISLVAARGGTITPPEKELVASLADGLGLTLRNSLLTAALRRQVADLRRSRDRVVTAADDARRSLEHALDSGPQQHLVAVKVRLGATRVLAEKAGAVRTAAILADIESQSGDAIQAVRDFAAGIYPPLLGAEGLGVALGHEARRGALPISVHAEGIHRYPRDVESAVYFAVLEALQNTAKYAEATSAEVILAERNGDLTFEVRDNGHGFDRNLVNSGAGLNGIADRMDAVGGVFHLVSSLGGGTVLTGAIPVGQSVPALAPVVA